MRDQRAHRISVLALERLAVNFVGKQAVVTERVFEWHVRGVAVLRVHDDVMRRRQPSGAVEEVA
jgi:hypothetical protein